MVKIAKIIGVPDAPAPDGTQAIMVETPDGERIRVEFPESQAVELVQQIQSAFLSRQFEGAQHPNYAYVDVRNVFLGHGPGGRVGLMVDTVQTAAIALIMSLPMAEHLKKEAERLVQHLSMAQKPH